MTKTTSLFTTGQSLEDIEAWAETTFPRAFNKVKEYLNNRDIAVRQYKFTRPIAFAQTRESYKDGLLVGETTVLAQPIYARLLGTRARVEICVDNGRHGLYRLSSGFGKYLNEPFTWLGSQEDERSKNRLTALIVYLYLRSDKSMRNARNVWTFKEGFRSACNVLAVALDQKEGNAGGSDQSSPWSESLRLLASTKTDYNCHRLRSQRSCRSCRYSAHSPSSSFKSPLNGFCSILFNGLSSNSLGCF